MQNVKPKNSLKFRNVFEPETEKTLERKNVHDVFQDDIEYFSGKSELQINCVTYL